MRYESTFGSWSHLSPDDASERTYALGVAAVLGEDHSEEFDRLAQLQSMAIAEMLFDVGRSHANSMSAALGVPDGALPGEPAASLIWNRLVEDPPTNGPHEVELLVG